MEFLLDSVYYLYNYYMVCTLLSYTYYMTLSCDITLWHSWYMTMMCDICHVILFHTSFLYSKSKWKKKKKKKKNINNDLAVLPSHDTTFLLRFLILRTFCSRGHRCSLFYYHLLLSTLWVLNFLTQFLLSLPLLFLLFFIP